MTTQPEALRLADELDKRQHHRYAIYLSETDTSPEAAELRRLHLHELALQDWLNKTDWVQETAQAGELGMHRADVLKKRIEKLEAINQELLAALKDLLHESDGCIHVWTYNKTKEAIDKAERTTT